MAKMRIYDEVVIKAGKKWNVMHVSCSQSLISHDWVKKNIDFNGEGSAIYRY